MISQQQMKQAYIEACELDTQAFKPGNVSIYSDGHDMTVADFSISAKVSADPITNPNYCLGEKIFYAVKETRAAVGCNTNLGIILLCAPLIEAAYRQQQGQSLRSASEKVLEQTTVDDAAWVFKAIELAAPGGLGESKEQDVKDIPVVSLVEAMEIASEKDRIAKQFTTNYKDIFDFAILRYNSCLVRFGSKDWAAASVFTGMLRKFPDSHIERKYGNQYSGWVLEQIIPVDDALLSTNKPEQLLPMLHDVDRMFKAKSINPGTTADLTVATVLVYFMEAFSVR